MILQRQTRRHALLLAIVIGCLMSGTTSANDADWTGWRGPHRDGWTAYEPPAEWPDELSLAWQLNVGTGYASPLVVGDRIFQHARKGNDEVVLCLELTTGKIVWQKKYAVPFKMGGGGERHGKGPKSTPAIAEGRLFTLSITGVLSAWDAADGDLLWRHDYQSQFTTNHPYWGVATSPLVIGDRVLVHVGNDKRGALLAHDVASGEQLWSQGTDAPSYASPVVIEIGGVPQFMELTQRGLTGIDVEHGKVLWHFDYPQIGTDQNMVTPAFHSDTILLGGENRGILGLKLQRTDGKWSATRQWHQKRVALDMSSAVVNGELLYGFSHYGSGRLFCLDIKSGEILWQGPGRVGQNVAFLSFPGHVAALVNNGQLEIIKATGERYERVARYRVADGNTWAPPVLHPQGILIKDLESLALWTIPVD